MCSVAYVCVCLCVYRAHELETRISKQNDLKGSDRTKIANRQENDISEQTQTFNGNSRDWEKGRERERINGRKKQNDSMKTHSQIDESEEKLSERANDVFEWKNCNIQATDAY